MPDLPERPFLTDPSPAGTSPGGLAPAPLFDLAVNRAWAALRGQHPAQAAAASALAAWHARTRFARRVPLADIRRALALHPPGQEPQHWAGGPGGGWQPGKAPFP